MGAPGSAADGDDAEINGRIDIYIKNNDTWILSDTIEGTGDKGYAFGRWVSITDDGQYILQTTFGSNFGGNEQSSLLNKQSGGDTASLTLPESVLIYDGNGTEVSNITALNLDGTYPVTNGGTNYGDTVAVTFVSDLAWLLSDGGSVTANVSDGVVQSVTIAGINDSFKWWYDSELEILKQGLATFVLFADPPSVWTIVHTFPFTRGRPEISADGSRLGVSEPIDPVNVGPDPKKDPMNFNIYDVSSSGVTLVHSQNVGGNTAYWGPTACTPDGSRFVVAPQQTEQYVITFSNDAWTTQQLNNSYVDVRHASLSVDGEYLFLSDRKSKLVDFFELTNGEYVKVNTIRGSFGNFGGGQNSSVQLTKDKSKLLICSRNQGQAGLGEPPLSVIAGAAYIYTMDATKKWNRVTSIPFTDNLGVFAYSAAITNNTVVVSTVYSNGEKTNFIDIYDIADKHDNLGIDSRAQAIANLKNSVNALQAYNADTSKLVAKPLGDVPAAPGDFAVATGDLHGYLALRDSQNQEIDQLVSMYAQGISPEWSLDVHTTTLSNGTVTHHDTTMSSTGPDIVTKSDLINNINLMTIGAWLHFKVSCKFKVASLDKPAMSLMYDIAAHDTNSYNAKYFDITSPTVATSRTLLDGHSTGPSTLVAGVWYTLEIETSDTEVICRINGTHAGQSHLGAATGGYLGVFANNNVTVQEFKFESGTSL